MITANFEVCMLCVAQIVRDQGYRSLFHMCVHAFFQERAARSSLARESLSLFSKQETAF